MTKYFSDKSVYTPPEFLRNKIRDREGLKIVVDKFNEVGEYSIKSIMEFESSFYAIPLNK